MIVVDASALYEVLIGGKLAEPVRAVLLNDADHAAPEVVDAEVLSVLRRDEAAGRVDMTTAALAAHDLRDWPADRFGHRGLLDRAWELRHTVRIMDALYVALAEALDATLVTLDRRLAAAPGPSCPFLVPR